MTNRPLLVVGVGNRSRGDDRIGPAVVDAVRTHPELAGADTIVATGDLSDLVVTWTPNHDVVIVDAMIGGRAPGTVVVIDGLNDPLPATGRPLSSHGFGLVDTIELARLLGRSPRTLTVIAVELGGTGLLDPMTKTAADAVATVVSTIVSLANRRRDGDDRDSHDHP